MSAQFKKLRLQYEYLNLEKDEVKDICDQMGEKIKEFFSSEYPEEYKKFLEINAKTATSKKINNPTKETQIKKPKEFKKLYHRIARKIHPDNNSTGDNQLFKAAAKAYSENNLSKLVEIADLLEIEIPKFSKESIYILEVKIQAISEDIDHLKKTSGWAWSFLQTDEEKKQFIKSLISTIKGERHDI
tara:strand:- start:78 stop:638 length:561 start_codon:yes stop_codon:yes gene_type:complete